MQESLKHSVKLHFCIILKALVLVVDAGLDMSGKKYA